jgi:uncharacterized protein
MSIAQEPENTPIVQPTRRKFLRRVAWGGTSILAAGGLGIGYGFWEASQIRIRYQTVTLPRLPAAFAGKTIAVLGDFHNGPLVSLKFIRRAVEIAQSLKADIYALVGDFAHNGTKTREQLHPCLDLLSALDAPFGVYAVPGNHDMQDSGKVYREIMQKNPISDLTNRSVRLKLGADELWLAGVDELWWGKPDQRTALRDLPPGAEVILLSHNPDFAEEQPDPRVGLVLSGHTHGGQVYIPNVKLGRMPTRYGEKYRAGLVQGPASQVFVTRGLGEAGIPVRLNCPPEINLLTLKSGG